MLDEVNPYDVARHLPQDAQGNDVYVVGRRPASRGASSGRAPRLGGRDERRRSPARTTPSTSPSPTGATRTTASRPRASTRRRWTTRMAQPVWQGADAPAYFTRGRVRRRLRRVHARQARRRRRSGTRRSTTRRRRKDYIEFLRDEINGTGGTLSSPAPSGEATPTSPRPTRSSPTSRAGATRSTTSGCTTAAPRPCRCSSSRWSTRRRRSPPTTSTACRTTPTPWC